MDAVPLPFRDVLFPDTQPSVDLDETKQEQYHGHQSPSDVVVLPDEDPQDVGQAAEDEVDADSVDIVGLVAFSDTFELDDDEDEHQEINDAPNRERDARGCEQRRVFIRDRVRRGVVDPADGCQRIDDDGCDGCDDVACLQDGLSFHHRFNPTSQRVPQALDIT